MALQPTHHQTRPFGKRISDTDMFEAWSRALDTDPAQAHEFCERVHNGSARPEYVRQFVYDYRA